MMRIKRESLDESLWH